MSEFISENILQVVVEIQRAIFDMIQTTLRMPEDLLQRTDKVVNDSEFNQRADWLRMVAKAGIQFHENDQLDLLQNLADKVDLQESESDERASSRDWNEVSISDPQPIGPFEASFSDNSVLKRTNRPAMLACHIEDFREKRTSCYVSEQELISLCRASFNIVDNRTARKYIDTVVAAGVLTPHISMLPEFSGQDSFKMLQTELVNSFKGRDDVVLREYAKYYGEQCQTVFDLTGTPDSSPWLSKKPHYYFRSDIAEKASRRYLIHATEQAPELGDWPDNESSQRVMNRLFTVALSKSHLMSPAGARHLMKDAANGGYRFNRQGGVEVDPSPEKHGAVFQQDNAVTMG